MNANSIRFCCPHCSASIKAPTKLSGQKRACPGCSEAFVVPRVVPQDAGPVLVLLEREDRFVLGVAPRVGSRSSGLFPLRRTA